MTVVPVPPTPWWRRRAVLIGGSAAVVVLIGAGVGVAVSSGAPPVAAPAPALTPSSDPSAAPEPISPPEPIQRPIRRLDVSCAELASADLVAAVLGSDADPIRVGDQPIAGLHEAALLTFGVLTCHWDADDDGTFDLSLHLVPVPDSGTGFEEVLNEPSSSDCGVGYGCRGTYAAGEVAVNLLAPNGADPVAYAALVDHVRSRAAALGDPAPGEPPVSPGSAFSWDEWWEEPTAAIVRDAFAIPDLQPAGYDDIGFQWWAWQHAGFQLAVFGSAEATLAIESLPAGAWAAADLASRADAEPVTIEGASHAVILPSSSGGQVCFLLDDAAVCVQSYLGVDRSALLAGARALVAAIGTDLSA